MPTPDPLSPAELRGLQVTKTIERALARLPEHNYLCSPSRCICERGSEKAELLALAHELLAAREENQLLRKRAQLFHSTLTQIAAYAKPRMADGSTYVSREMEPIVSALNLCDDITSRLSAGGAP